MRGGARDLGGVRAKGRRVGRVVLALTAAVVLAAGPLFAGEPRSIDGPALFEKLKSHLVGEWTGRLQPIGKPVEAGDS